MEITENDIMKTSIIFILISRCTHIVLLIEIFNTCKKKNHFPNPFKQIVAISISICAAIQDEKVKNSVVS